MEGDGGHILRRPELVGVNVGEDPDPDIGEDIEEDGRWSREDYFFLIGVILAAISGMGILVTILLFGSRWHFVTVSVSIIGLTISTTAGCCVCVLYGYVGQSRSTVGSTDVTEIEVMPGRTPVKVISRQATVKRKSGSRVPAPSQAHLTDPAVPGPSGLQHHEAGGSSEHSRLYSGSNEEATESESPPRTESFVVPEAPVTRSSAARKVAQAAASIAQFAGGSVRKARDIAAINKSGSGQKASGVAASGAGKGKVRESRSLRLRTSVVDLRTLSCDREEGGD